MQMSWYVSNGGGIQFYINDFTTGAHFCNPCSYSNGRTNNEWSQVSYHSDTSGTWTGTAVTTGHLTTPDYQNASGNWVEQPNGGNFNDFDDPTQGYWHQAPPNLAADAFWCDQASSSSCLLKQTLQDGRSRLCESNSPRTGGFTVGDGERVPKLGRWSDDGAPGPLLGDSVDWPNALRIASLNTLGIPGTQAL